LANAERDVEGDLDSLRKVIDQGYSAKDEEGGMRRGTGLRNIGSLLVKSAAHGRLSLLSGTALYYNDWPSGHAFVDVGPLSWQGTIVALTFRKPSAPINIYDYVR
jgi:hypothetical protein